LFFFNYYYQGTIGVGGGVRLSSDLLVFLCLFAVHHTRRNNNNKKNP